MVVIYFLVWYASAGTVVQSLNSSATELEGMWTSWTVSSGLKGWVVVWYSSASAGVMMASASMWVY